MSNSNGQRPPDDSVKAAVGSAEQVRAIHHDIVALSKPVVAIAREQRSVIAQIRTLEGVKEHSVLEAARLSDLRQSYDKLRTSVIHPLNALLGYLLDNFTGSLTKDEFDLAWKMELQVIESAEAMSTIADKLIPMTVIRQLSRDYKLAFPFTSVPYFREYTARYSTFAIATK